MMFSKSSPKALPDARTLFWAVFDRVTKPTFLVSAAILLLALVLGVIIPVYVSMIGAKPSKLLAMPALILLVAFLLWDKRILLITILLLRSIGDPILELTKVSVGGMQLGLGLAVNLLVIFIAGLFVLERPKEFPRALANAWWPFIVLATIAFVITPNKSEAIRVLLAACSYFAMFIAATYMVRTREDFQFAVKVVICSSILPTLYAFVEMALQMRDSNFRLYSTFTHPNILAFYLTLVISLLLYCLKSASIVMKPGVRFAVTMYMLVEIALLLLTQTRSAWIACATLFVIYAIFFERKYLLYLALMPVVAALIPSVRDRILDLAGGNGDDVYAYARLNSFAWRVLLWDAGLRWMEPGHYLFGYGLEAFRFHSQTFFTRAGGIDWSPHNLLVQILFDMGLVGLAAYLFTFWRMIGRLRGLITIDRLAAVLLIANVIAHLIISLSDNIFAYLVFNWYFWFIIGGACSLAPQLRARRNYHPAVAASPPAPSSALR